MRVLLVVPPSIERLHALVPLGWALRTGGCEAHVASQPSFAAAINAAGFVAVPVGGAGPEAGDLTSYVSLWRPSVIVRDATVPVTPAAGTADVRVLGPHDVVAADGSADGSADGPALALDLVPPSLRPSGCAARPLRFVPYSGPAVVPSWLRRPPRRPRVLVAADVPATALPRLVAGAGRGVEMVCALPADGVPAGTVIPASVRVVESAPPAAVLPTCAAVVHGGSLVLDALAAGLPQLVCGAPASPGAADLAARVAAAGAGLLDGDLDGHPDDSGGGAGDAVRRLVDDAALRAHAAGLAAEIAATPGPHEVVAGLADLAGLLVGSAART